MATNITKYRVLKLAETGRIMSIQPFVSDWLPRYIPIDADNTDYQAYLEWAKTNTAEEVLS
tara:strand:+ start:1130 stop:1312 length:183 start_codon:yes stop_codon:yes gene_type:complete